MNTTQHKPVHKTSAVPDSEVTGPVKGEGTSPSVIAPLPPATPVIAATPAIIPSNAFADPILQAPAVDATPLAAPLLPDAPATALSASVSASALPLEIPQTTQRGKTSFLDTSDSGARLLLVPSALCSASCITDTADPAEDQLGLNVPLDVQDRDAPISPHATRESKRRHPSPIAPPSSHHQPTPSFLLDEYSSDSDSPDQPFTKRSRTEGGPIGISLSAMASKKLKASMLDGTFKVNSARLERFKTTCRMYDMSAEFRLEEKWRVYHSVCGKWYTMKEAYSVTRFRSHVAACRVRLKQLASVRPKAEVEKTGGLPARPTPPSQSFLRTSTLDKWAKKMGWTTKERQRSQLKEEAPDLVLEQATSDEAVLASSGGVAAPRVAGGGGDEDTAAGAKRYMSNAVPCSGITASCEPRVVTYLERTGTRGGSAPSVTSVARTLFNDESVVFADLSEENKEAVRTEQKHRWAWRNDHTALAVFSTACRKTVYEVLPSSSLSSLCSACELVLRLKLFRNALNVPVPDKDNYKFLNERYRNELLGKVYTRVHGLSELLDDTVRPVLPVCLLLSCVA